MKTKFCFLNAIYYENNRDVGYELVLADRHLLYTNIYRDTLEGIQKFINNKEWVFDFEINGSFFKCDSRITRIHINDQIKASFGKLIEKNKNESKTLYSLLADGVENDFIFLDDNVISEDSWVGLSIAKFSSIKVSQSTMSIYCRIVKDAGILNRMIVYLDKNKLVQNSFYFGVPSSFSYKDQGFEFIKSMNINGEDYTVWNTGNLPIYDSNVFISYCLINKACCARNRLNNLYNTLTDYVDLAYKVRQIDVPERKKWIGSQKNYQSDFGIWFKSNVKKLSGNDRIMLLQKATEILKESDNCEQAVAKAKAYTTNLEKRYVLMNLVSILYTDDPLQFVVSYREYTSSEILNFDLYLYKIRSLCFFTKKHLTQSNNIGILTGSDEYSYTIVEEGFAYGY